jgi:hypothetical protein
MMPDHGARAWYAEGVRAHYARHGHAYQNPHVDRVERSIRESLARWNLDTRRCLDLAAGGGEASVPLIEAGSSVDAIDPYTHELYQSRLGRACEPLTFADVAGGALASRNYTLIVCSFALHLCERSMLPALGIALAQIAPRLLVIAPQKRPGLDARFGWMIQNTMTLDRVHTRLFHSTLLELVE